MFIEQAVKVKNDWWRYLIGTLCALFGWQFIGVIPLFVVAFFKADNLQHFIASSEKVFMDLGIDSNLFLVLMIFSFAMGLLGLWFAVRFLNEQSVTSLTTSRSKIDWGRIRFSFLLVIGIYIPLFTVGYFMEPEIYQWNFQLVPFCLLLLVAFFLLPIQTSFEEYLFRGYWMQGFGVLTKNRWAPLLITSITFGLLHWFNPEKDVLGPMVMIFYIGTGLLLGVLTLMDEGMELSLGFHAANNIIAAVLVTTDWSALQTNALFIDTSEPTIGFDIVVPMLIQYPIFLFILSKKYKWSNWKEKLFGKVVIDTNHEYLDNEIK